VFGRRAGLAAAQYALGRTSRPDPEMSEIIKAEQEMLQPFELETGENPFTVQEDLQNMMMLYVGVFRDEARLTKALELLEPLKERAARVRAAGSRLYNAMWHTALDVKHSVRIAETIIVSALLRKESRAAHSRVDYPQTSDELQKVNTVTRSIDGAVTVAYVERTPLPAELAAVIEEKVEVPT